MQVLVRPLPPRNRRHRRRRLLLLLLRLVQHQKRRRRRHQRGRRSGLPLRGPAMEVENSPPPVHQPVRFDRVTVAPVHHDHPRLLVLQHLPRRQKSFIQQIALTTLQQGKHQLHHRHHQHHQRQRHHHPHLRRVELADSRQLLRHPDFGPISHETLCGVQFTLNPPRFQIFLYSVTSFRFFPKLFSLTFVLLYRSESKLRNIIYFIMVSKNQIVQID